VIPQAVLDAVESLSVSTWEPDGDDGRHVGPMAEEFAEVFELGADDGTIATVDADGVALAALQGVAERLDAKDDRIEERNHRIERLEAENEALRERLDAVEERFGVSTAAEASTTECPRGRSQHQDWKSVRYDSLTFKGKGVATPIHG